MVDAERVSGGEGLSKYSRHKRKDANHGEIVSYFRGCGAVVDDVSGLADLGYDLVVSYVGSVVFCEIKDGEKPPSRRALTDSEKAAMVRHSTKYAVVSSILEAQGLLESMAEHGR